MQFYSGRCEWHNHATGELARGDVTRATIKEDAIDLDVEWNAKKYRIRLIPKDGQWVGGAPGLCQVAISRCVPSGDGHDLFGPWSEEDVTFQFKAYLQPDE